MARPEALVQVGGRALRFTNPDKVLYPATGFTKRDVLDYYLGVAPWLLPHLEKRPVTLKRYPNGVGQPHFYEKDAPGFTPPWVSVFPVPRRHGGPDIRYIVVDDRATLAWCASLANLELHPFLHRVPAIETPTSVVFDLDPGEGADVLTCAAVAFELKAVLDELGVAACPKVSGSKGLQIYVPLNTPVTYEQTEAFARRLANLLERRHPELVVSDTAKHRRAGKVFIDWSQNASYKTTVGVYSLRGKRDRPFVSAPVTWDELARAMKTRASGPLFFTPEAMLRRLDDVGDLFRPVLRLRQRLPGATAVAQTRTPRAPRRRAEPEPAPRRARQGSRRRFVVEKAPASKGTILRLEIGRALKGWAVEPDMPRRAGQPRPARAVPDQPLDAFPAARTPHVRDLGTYEVIEGSYASGTLDVHLAGRTVKGEWVLARQRGEAWRLTRRAS